MQNTLKPPRSGRGVIEGPLDASTQRDSETVNKPIMTHISKNNIHITSNQFESSEPVFHVDSANALKNFSSKELTHTANDQFVNYASSQNIKMNT